ncbi:ATP-grasp domain-containing protein [Neobacillus niacini]|uniref:ATP-grasp domain-containing protein n=1 Tax=Neobacillus niacini TaxID=86668 RepID=UPI0005EFAFEC|nr:ATP-grasp domain-containing protein [Neobacillus niacini]
MNRTILVSAIGGDVGHSVLKCLLQEKDKLIGCDLYQFPVGLNVVDGFFTSLPALHSNYISHLLEHCKKYQVTHFIPISEPEIEVVSDNLEVFQKEKIKVLINQKEIIQYCLDKNLSAKKLKSIGLDVPDSWLADDFEPDGKKYIVKFIKSWGSKLLRVIATKEELEQIKKSFTQPLLIQEYIDEPDNEYTVGVFSDGEDIRVISFKRKLQGGYTKFVELINDETIKRDAMIAAKEFGLKGSFNIQLRKSNGRNYIFEINPRLSGSVHFRHLLGFKDVLWWLDSLDQFKLAEYKNPYSIAIGVRELNEKFLLVE